MRDLTPVRLKAGGSVLILVDGNGGEYAVPVGSIRETLGQAGSTAAPAAPQQTSAPLPSDPQPKEESVESTLRPRDIQARIRAGESAEDVAAVAGTSVEKVMIFASPVLAERAHVAQSAMAASVRRAEADPTAPSVSSVRTLGPAVGTRLRDEGVDPESVTWDAWRREDGRWTLEAAYSHDGDARSARFSFDAPGSFVIADDDDARWLVGDGQVPSRAPRPAAPVTADAEAPGLRLAPAYVDSEQAVLTPALGDDAIDLVSGDTADADWMGPAPTRAAAAADLPAQPVAADATHDAPADTEPTVETARHAEPRRTPKKRRTSVPSWDEIMFGGGS